MGHHLGKAFWLSSLIILLTVRLSLALPNIHFLNVGEGEAIWLECDRGENILIDTGNVITGAQVVNFLKRRGRNHLKAVIITHPHPDHMGGVFHIIPNLEIGTVYDNGQFIPPNPTCDIYRWYVALVRKRANYKVLKAGDRLECGSVQIKVLWPPKTLSKNWNTNSLVLRIIYKRLSALLMGDATRETESALLAQNPNLRADLLKVGHHGAADSTSEPFLKAVRPKWAVISIDKNNLRGYPAKKTLELLNKYGIKTFITYKHGNICWDLGLNSIRLEKF